MIEEPSLAVILVLLERHCERVRHVDDLAVVLPQKYAYNALLGASRECACMMIRYG